MIAFKAIQIITDADKQQHKEFCIDMLQWIEDNERFLQSAIFCDVCTFHECWKVNTYNCRIWGSESPHE
jgi:hypothetical protein